MIYPIMIYQHSNTITISLAEKSRLGKSDDIRRSIPYYTNIKSDLKFYLPGKMVAKHKLNITYQYDVL